MKNIFIITVILTILLSCKKESNSSIINSKISHAIQNVYLKQIEIEKLKGVQRIAFANEKEILWDKGLVIPNKKIVLFPIKAVNSKEPLNATYRYLQANLNSKNEANSFEYLLVSKQVNKKVGSIEINDVASMLDDNNTSNKVIIRYGLDNLQKINGVGVSESGTFNNPISTKMKKHENTSSLLEVPPGCTGYYINWYWTTWDENGNVISEEYLYTTEHIYCPTSGGGGGGTGNGNTNCSTAAINSFMNAGTVESGPIQIGNISGNGEIGINLRYNWLIFKAGTWGLLSYERASYEKIHYPNISRYEYTLFEHERITHQGMSIGGTRTYQDFGGVPNISPTRMRVDMRVDFSVTSSTCGITLTQNYNANKTFFAPNVVAPNGS